MLTTGSQLKAARALAGIQIRSRRYHEDVIRVTCSSLASWQR